MKRFRLGSRDAAARQKMADGTVKHLAVAVAAGKDNKIYIVDLDAMSEFTTTSNNNWQVLTGALASGIWGSPAWFNGTVYYGALNDNVKVLPVTNAMLATTAASKSPTTCPYPRDLRERHVERDSVGGQKRHDGRTACV